MPSVINRVPFGLLSLLDSQTGGAAPQALDELVHASIELREFYLHARSFESLVQTAAAVSSVGFFPGAATAAVPQNELWYVSQFSAQSNAVLGAGTTYRVAPAAAMPEVSRPKLLAQLQSFVAAELAAVGAQNVPLFLTPGSQLGVWCSQHTVGAGSLFFTYSAVISRMQI